jgi:hypothetical protein
MSWTRRPRRPVLAGDLEEHSVDGEVMLTEPRLLGSASCQPRYGARVPCEPGRWTPSRCSCRRGAGE